MPSGPPHTDHHDPDASRSCRETRHVRFAQARSIGILLVLAALLALVVYNTLAEGTPWVHRARDVRLLMTLLSILLGLDVLVGNRRALARIIGRVLLTYAEDPSTRQSSRPLDHQTDDDQTTDHASESSTSDRASGSE